MILPLYIDPGTGSMIFSLFIGLAAAGTFALRTVFLKLRFLVSGGRAKSMDEKNIPFVIFSDHRRYWNVFHSLCDEFESHGVDLTYYTASADDPVLSMPYKFVHAQYLGEKNKPYAKMNLLHADIVVSTTPGLGVYQWKRSRYVKWYVHIPHTVRSIYCYRMFGLDHYDAVLANGECQVCQGKEIESMRPGIARKEYVVVGSSVMDSLMEQRKSAEKPGKSEKPIVLVAPSWGKSGILTKFGERFLSALLKTRCNVIVRPHPQTATSERNVLDPLMERFPEIEWNFDVDNFSVLNKADVLISDFSGTMFDFALGFDKPVIYTDVEFDPSPYDMAWVSDIWEFSALPKIGVKLEEADFDRIDEIISEALRNEKLQYGRDELRSECWANTGGSARAEYDYLVGKQKILDKTTENK
ncbi:MAG: CDP-glycerol glycerophosphotransferase family protein [Treponema sp.]|nr:CDP-glycerol glycerophosphotransferase family protein [Treponema sp.]